MGILILIILTIGFYAVLSRALHKKMLYAVSQNQKVEKVLDQFVSDNSQLALQNIELQLSLKEKVELFEITREISKCLDEESVFKAFLGQIDKYMECKNCFFLKGSNVDLSIYKDYIIIALEINKVPAGYLVTSGIKQEDKERFNILAQQFLLGIKRAIFYQKVQELAIIDTVTGFFNRKHYLERLDEEVLYSQRFNFSFALLMLDIDHFKNFNDQYGHLVGDAILKEVSSIIKDNLRQIDLVGRYGGEEFSICLTQTDRAGAKLAAERIRQSLEKKAIRIYDESLNVTISIGVAMFPQDEKLTGLLVEKADKALYKAKQSGRNTVCFS